MRRVLLVEDDQDIRNLVELHLADLGYSVTIATTGEEGQALALEGGYDLVVLDLTLPDVDGIEICRALRSQTERYTPILMLTARTSEIDRVLGLETGADDYVTKPFSVRELVARVKAIFRRVDALEGPGEEPHVFEIDGLVIDLDRREATVEGKSVELTAREFDLLCFFARYPGRVYTRGQLLDSVWGYGHDGYEHTVNSHINRLRAKIEPDPTHPTYVLTVWGVGYKLREPNNDVRRKQGPNRTPAGATASGEP